MARAAIYAMIQLGCRKVFIYNRTVENAENVARHFNSWAAGLSSDGEVVRVLKSADAEWPSGFKFATMIVSCVPATSVGGQPPANFVMPPQWLRSTTGGVVVEVRITNLTPEEYVLMFYKLSYLPLDTPLLQQLRKVREQTKQAWVIVDGLEVLPEQAIAQFELMTGRKAPKKRMRLEVRHNYSRYAEQGSIS
jgi:shikimate 5-dehydrogenase